ncbi:hypothetical protein DES49_0750 [Halospina denitrificans]|uniref:DUF2333 family protein n=2 Tax=Halospina denitrificans TaxID=332522 RepID=A0A4R7JWW8_9GAMM|nr:hypothetical protein DES49_0750 [Halospina denitrificans]
MTWLRPRMSGLFRRLKTFLLGLRMRSVVMTPLIAIALLLVLMFVVSLVPSSFPEIPSQETIRSEFEAQHDGEAPPVGYHTTETLIRSIDIVVNKRGGFLSNDVMPPFVLMDNIPAWETGALRQARDLSLAMRNDITRSQSQSEEDPDMVQAQVLLNNDSEKWIFPSAESKYNEAISRLRSYREHLVDTDSREGDFYARSDNLVAALELMSKRLGSMSQNLAASVAEERRYTALANDPTSSSAKARPPAEVMKTPWMQVDNVFYQARGTTWAMLAYLQAFEEDFDRVLEDKNAQPSMDQIIRELKSTQKSLYSPMVLNGYEFGLVPNYSLAMSSYMTRANAGIIDIINLLRDG